jgi:hypothetical protein
LAAVGFRTRKRGTSRQIGKVFPVIERKKLPPRIAVKMPSFRNNETGLTDVTYTAPTLDKDGFISFNFGSDVVQDVVKLVPREQSIGQWDINKPIVYIDNKVPMIWQKSLSVHEALERHLQKKYGIPWQSGGHLISDQVEKRLFLQSRSLKEWNEYTRTVRFFGEMNRAGGKTGRDRIDLARAFEILAEKRRQLSWSGRGLDSIVQKQTDRRELTKFSKELKNAIDKKLGE